MSKLTLLSVAENNYQSHIMGASTELYNFGEHIGFYIGIDEDGNICIRKSTNKGLDQKIVLPPIDIDSMIEYLNEVKLFMAEAETVRRLMGKR